MRHNAYPPCMWLINTYGHFNIVILDINYSNTNLFTLYDLIMDSDVAIYMQPQCIQISQCCGKHDVDYL